MKNRVLSRTLNFFSINFSKSSIGHFVFLMLSNSLIVSSFSLPSLRRLSYKILGNKWNQGRWERNFPLQICWCPPNGICHAGKEIKTTPRGARNLFKEDIKKDLFSICSKTSWQIIKSKSPSFPLISNISEAKILLQHWLHERTF